MEWLPEAWAGYVSAKTPYARVRTKEGALDLVLTWGECALGDQNDTLVHGSRVDENTAFGTALADGEHCPYEHEPRSLFVYEADYWNPWWTFVQFLKRFGS